MARHPIPKVINGFLTPPEAEATGGALPAIQVGSADWYAWLNQTTTRSFAYHSAQGLLTARRESRHGTWYWYAYRSQHGRLHKAYLGKSEELTPQRLKEAVARLTKERASNAEPDPTSSSEQSPGAFPLPSASSAHLLMTKLHIPPARLNMVSRSRLTERLNVGMKSRLTLIVAPAGWGKTTLLSAWHAQAGRIAWVSLDVGDNDPVRFWTYVITALNRLHPGVGDVALTVLRSPQTPPIESVLTLLLNALATLPGEIIVVLDDYHLIQTQSIHDALTFLLDHLPSSLHLVIASRLDPPLPLALLRARDALTELRVADLRFTLPEATTFLTVVMGLPLSPEESAALEARTEGWIAGLHLAALSLQGREDLASFITAFTGSNRYVVDYLVEEVLQRQPEDVQQFLLCTCLLDRLSGPLCDAMHGSDGSQGLLEYLERANLFIIALDDERQWYRYHHLFAEVLRSRLQQMQPALIPHLHHRASLWYEQHEMFAEAISHALAVSDVERAAHLIEQRAMLLAQRGRAHLVLSWLNALPDVVVQTHPYLCIIHALVLMLSHQLEASEGRLQDAERCVQADMPAEQAWTIQGWVAAIRGTFAIFSGDLAQNVAYSRQALDLLPETEVIGRAGAIVGASRAFLVSGDVTPATEQQVLEVIASARASGNLVSILRARTLLARLHMLQGKLRQAAVTYEEGVQGVPGQGELRVLVSGPPYSFGLGDLLREWNDLDAAEALLAQGMELVKGLKVVEAEIATRGYIALARLLQAQGENIRALETLDAFARLAHQWHFVPRLIAHGAAMRAQVELARGNVAAAIRWADESDLSALDEPDYLHELEYLTLARVRIAQGRAHPAGTFLSDTLLLLDRLLEDAEVKMRMSTVLEILVLRALALQAQGDQAGAMSALERALVLAEPEGYMRLFLDNGVPMENLLRQAQVRGLAPGYVTRLLHAFDKQAKASHHLPVPQSSPLMEPLTEREREVLQLLLEGASNRAIASHLVLSVNTVKKHVYNICGKLGVQSRMQAIAKARVFRLL